MTEYDKTILNRLKRAEGQLRGVQRMIEEGNECVDIITQLSAVRSSVDRVVGIIVAENLKYCLENPDLDKDAQKEKIDQALKLIVKK